MKKEIKDFQFKEAIKIKSEKKRKNLKILSQYTSEEVILLQI